MNAYEAAEKAGKADELHRQLLDLAKAFNRATDGSTAIPATFMRVTVRRRVAIWILVDMILEASHWRPEGRTLGYS